MKLKFYILAVIITIATNALLYLPVFVYEVENYFGVVMHISWIMIFASIAALLASNTIISTILARDLKIKDRATINYALGISTILCLIILFGPVEYMVASSGF